jgi:hypothetical protein
VYDKKMKKHLSIIVAVALPLLFIAVFSVFLFITRVSIDPQYDFVYKSVEYKYDVSDTAPNEIAEYFLYSVEDDSISKINEAELETLNINDDPTSSDGYLVKYEYGHNGIFEMFGSNEKNGYYITRPGAGTGNGKKIETGDNYYRNNIEFIGWIEEFKSDNN